MVYFIKKKYNDQSNEFIAQSNNLSSPEAIDRSCVSVNLIWENQIFHIGINLAFNKSGIARIIAPKIVQESSESMRNFGHSEHVICPSSHTQTVTDIDCKLLLVTMHKINAI